jgi:hypothetical protein
MLRRREVIERLEYVNFFSNPAAKIFFVSRYHIWCFRETMRLSTQYKYVTISVNACGCRRHSTLGGSQMSSEATTKIGGSRFAGRASVVVPLPPAFTEALVDAGGCSVLIGAGSGCDSAI